MSGTIMFTGARSAWPVDFILSDLEAETPDLVIVGDAGGVDNCVRVVCRRLGIPVAMFVAEWGRLGRKAGPRRNQDMVEAMLLLRGHTVYAYPKGLSPGTRDCIDRVKDTGMTVRVMEL